MSYKIKLFLTDVDGVLTDGTYSISENGDEIKHFYVPDGMGLVQLKKLGVKIGIVTTDDSNLIRKRAEKIKVDYLKMGSWDKLAVAEGICKELGIQLSEVAFIGDDVNDYELLSRVGFAACPSDAQTQIKKINQIHVMKASGGRGAVREFIHMLVGEDAILKAWRMPHE